MNENPPAFREEEGRGVFEFMAGKIGLAECVRIGDLAKAHILTWISVRLPQRLNGAILAVFVLKAKTPEVLL